MCVGRHEQLLAMWQDNRALADRGWAPLQWGAIESRGLSALSENSISNSRCHAVCHQTLFNELRADMRPLTPHNTCLQRAVADLDLE